jgi:Zn-dependent protease
LTRQQKIAVAVAIFAGALLAGYLIAGHSVSTNELIFFACLVPSIILHEISHGAVAWAFGDDTARRAGRLTLNPISHIDPIGSIILPAILVFAGAPPFGWAKPVPVNPQRMRSPRNNWLVVALAGPATNLVIAALSAVAFRLTFNPAVPTLGIGSKILFYLGLGNALLAAFNLLPIPPLDGSAVVERALPEHMLPGYYRIRSALILLPFLVLYFAPLRNVLIGAENHIFSLWANAAGLPGF